MDITIRVSEHELVALDQAARQFQCSIPEYIRRLLAATLPDFTPKPKRDKSRETMEGLDSYYSSSVFGR